MPIAETALAMRNVSPVRRLRARGPTFGSTMALAANLRREARYATSTNGRSALRRSEPDHAASTPCARATFAHVQQAKPEEEKPEQAEEGPAAAPTHETTGL